MWTLLRGAKVRPTPAFTCKARLNDCPRSGAYRNDEIHPVPIKTVEQQVFASIHRFRSGWISSRTGQVNTLRGRLRELGIVSPLGIEKVLPQVRLLIEDADSTIPDSLRSTMTAACDDIESLSQRIRQAERELETLAKQAPSVQHFLTGQTGEWKSR